jgi:plastocyanin
MRRNCPGLSLSFALLAALSLMWGCGGSNSSESAAPKSPAGAPAGKRVDPSSAGRIIGRVAFEGTAPAPASLDTSSDAKCIESGKTVRDESVVVNNGALENVFVYVKDGLGDYAFDVPTEPAKLDQHGCAYVPHVLGVRVGQPLEVINSDPTTHNVHAAASVNQQVNTAQPFKGMTYTHSFSVPEVMVPFKCDIHSWMLAWVGVLNHPYFAVSGNGGSFELKEVPPGTYTIEAWHEKFGTRSEKVTLGDKESKELTFTFKAS